MKTCKAWNSFEANTEQNCFDHSEHRPHSLILWHIMLLSVHGEAGRGTRLDVSSSCLRSWLSSLLLPSLFFLSLSSVDYETFDILEDEEVIKYFHHCGIHCCFHWSWSSHLQLFFLGAARTENLLKLANIPSAVRERWTCWRVGYC